MVVKHAGTGYCAVTGGEPGCPKGSQITRTKGWFKGVHPTVTDCFASCVSCSACRYISYSQVMNDCSWYAACRLGSLGQATGRHRTYVVRHPNGKVRDAVLWQINGTHGAATASFEQPRRVFFHEHSAAHTFAYSVHPDFKMNGVSLSELAQWAQLLRTSHWAERAVSAPLMETCAVVGSSAELLRHTFGPAIDAHQVVYRVNLARTDEFERHVGKRTSIRVWGDQQNPDASDVWTHANETILLLCTAIAVHSCWRTIPNSPRPRFSPFALGELSLAIHSPQMPLQGQGSHSSRDVFPRGPTGLRIYPTSGAMAIWAALAQCRRVTLFGFGWCDGRQPGYEQNAVYYDPNDGRKKKGFGIWHAPEQEERWIRRMVRRGIVNRSCV